MCLSQVGNMNIVSYASTMLCPIVCFKDRDVFFPIGNLENKRDQMCLRIMSFSNCSAHMSAASIAVTQWGCWQSGCNRIMEGKRAGKKTPQGVNSLHVLFVWGSKRSPRGGGGPPLPLSLVAKCVSSYAATFERRKSPRTRSDVF